MLEQWKKILFVVIVAGIVYAGCNTQMMLKTESFFRTKNPELALTPKVCYLLGDIAYLTFRYQLAIDIIKRNLKDFPYQPGAEDAEYRLAVCYEKLGNYDEAISLYENFLLDHPQTRRYESTENKISKLKALHQPM
jgi:tetratricopeptide (TPR) repeat protein